MRGQWECDIHYQCIYCISTLALTLLWSESKRRNVTTTSQTTPARDCTVVTIPYECVLSRQTYMLRCVHNSRVVAILKRRSDDAGECSKCQMGSETALQQSTMSTNQQIKVKFSCVYKFSITTILGSSAAATAATAATAAVWLKEYQQLQQG